MIMINRCFIIPFIHGIKSKPFVLNRLRFQSPLTTSADNATAKLHRIAMKEVRRINHALENSPDKASLEILEGIMKKRSFQINFLADEEKVIMTRVTDAEKVAVTYYTWSNHESLAYSNEDDPILFEFFSVALEKTNQPEVLLFKCLYNPLTLVDVSIVPKDANYYDNERYQGRDVGHLPPAVKVMFISPTIS